MAGWRRRRGMRGQTAKDIRRTRTRAADYARQWRDGSARRKTAEGDSRGQKIVKSRVGRGRRTLGRYLAADGRQLGARAISIGRGPRGSATAKMAQCRTRLNVDVVRGQGRSVADNEGARRRGKLNIGRGSRGCSTAEGATRQWVLDSRGSPMGQGAQSQSKRR